MLLHTNIKRLWEELNILDTNTQYTCLFTCGGKTKFDKAEHDGLLIQLLIDLNEVYIVIRGSILMMHLLTTMLLAFSILVQEEKHHEVRHHSHIHLDSTSPSVKTRCSTISSTLM